MSRIVMTARLHAGTRQAKYLPWMKPSQLALHCFRELLRLHQVFDAWCAGCAEHQPEDARIARLCSSARTMMNLRLDIWIGIAHLYAPARVPSQTRVLSALLTSFA